MRYTNAEKISESYLAKEREKVMAWDGLCYVMS